MYGLIEITASFQFLFGFRSDFGCRDDSGNALPGANPSCLQTRASLSWGPKVRALAGIWLEPSAITF